MVFRRKKKDIEHLKASFGKQKDDRYNFELIEKYFRNKDNSTAFQVLSDKTCNDLDFDELFMFTDRTHSKVGQQYLYNKLRTIPCKSEKLELNEKIIQEFTAETDFRIETQKQLGKLEKTDVYYISSLFQDKHIERPKWFFVIRLLSLTNLISLLLLPFNDLFIFVIFGITIISTVIHYWNKKNLFQYLDSIPQLLRLNRVAIFLHKHKILKEINPDLPASTKTITQVRNRMSFFQFEASLQGDYDAFVWGLLEIFKIFFLLEPLLLFGVLKRLNTKRREIENVFNFVGQVDVLMSIASLRNGLKTFCLPVVNEETNNISATQIYHPLIEECVPNNINVSDKSILLTGSNMSGKTSFIRTIGLNVITGLTINTCFAQSITISRIRIYSAIRISDDLMNDKSYYFEEVLTIKEMIEKSENGKPNLFLLDEIFKGTNTVERISAGKAVLSSLSKNNNMVFVSTHDIELTDLLASEFELFHFSEIIENKNIDFDYKLKDGKLKNRNAIRILQINDYPENIIREAIELSKVLDTNTSLSH
jgi:DNA mismatch repair ATPase MutS